MLFMNTYERLKICVNVMFITISSCVALCRCVVARFAFEGEGEELSFTEGDVITLIEYVNEEWGRGLLNGQTGIFPLSFIQEALPRKPESPGK